MTGKTMLGLMAVMAMASMAFFYLFQVQITEPFVRFFLNPQFMNVVERSLEDQKLLASLDNAGETMYKNRFEEISALKRNLQVLELNRSNLATAYGTAYLAVWGLILLASGAIVAANHRRTERHLLRFRDQLVALADERDDIPRSISRRGIFKRIESMIFENAAVQREQRQRVRYLEHLSLWQESARRHAHEIRAPLTAARLELDALAGGLESHLKGLPLDEWRSRRKNILEALERLNLFTRGFAAFGKMGRPKLAAHPLDPWLEEFCELYHRAWPELTLNFEGQSASTVVSFDSDMVRRVLSNLCANSAHALGETGRSGEVTIRSLRCGKRVAVEVCDNGPGVPDSVAGKLFEPYVTTRAVGEGMGLGLAIAKKLMLDQRGDLVLHHTSAEGACFRLLFSEPKEAGA